MGFEWQLAKEATGFVGALLAAIPWMRDFARRIKRGKVKGVRVTGSLENIAADLIERHDHWLAGAKGLDLAFTLGGLILIAISFLIGIWLAT